MTLRPINNALKLFYIQYCKAYIKNEFIYEN